MTAPMMRIPQFLSHLRFLRDRPRVAARLAANVFHAMVRGRPRMKNMELAVTYRCNQKCEMCSATTLRDPDRQVLSVEEIVEVVDACK
jgi:MoaA/NifB/PqqE/SkfB family radical SAM enzyme